MSNIVNKYTTTRITSQLMMLYKSIVLIQNRYGPGKFHYQTIHFRSPKGKKGKEKEQKPVTPPPQPEVKVIETPPPPKPLKGPKCWVDDATITSEKDILNDEENICNISQTSKPGSPTGKTQTKHQVKIEIGETENIQTLPEPVKKMDTLVLEEVELVTTNGLPPYICPSSEERSRQEAIKDWLAKCSFDSANRCVPMF